MKIFDEIIAEVNQKLTEEQIQLLKDTIRYGCWGDADMDFIEKGESVMDYAMGYITNDAKKAGHFSGRKISAMFRSIYNRLGINQKPGWGANEYFIHFSDWWGDGSGDVFFIRSDREGNNGEALYSKFEKWARG